MMDTEQLEKDIAHFWSEFTNDNAPIGENGIYKQAANAFLKKYNVTPKESN